MEQNFQELTPVHLNPRSPLGYFSSFLRAGWPQSDSGLPVSGRSRLSGQLQARAVESDPRRYCRRLRGGRSIVGAV